MCYTLKNGKRECYSDPSRPKRKWYHLTYIKIKGDSVFADQSPINIYKNDTLYSASDGAFYYYRGTIDRHDSVALIKMKLIYCDYCAIPAEGNKNAYLFPSTKTYNCKLTNEGLIINGHLFKKTNIKEVLISEHSKPSI